MPIKYVILNKLINGEVCEIKLQGDVSHIQVDENTNLDDYLESLRQNIESSKYVHPTTAGNKHIPSGGKSGQVLAWSSNGTAKWSDINVAEGDTQVYNENNNTAKAYLTGTVNNETAVGKQVFDDNVYLSENPGELCAKQFTTETVNLGGAKLQYDSTNSCINFLFE